MRRNALTVVAGLALLVFVKALVGCSPAMNDGVSASVGGAPVFEVDPFWPKPLPNSWLMGQAAGVAVDKRNHVWVVQRPKIAHRGREGRHADAAALALLRAGAARARVRPVRRARAVVGRPRPPVSRGRTTSTASTWTTRTTSGWPATARRTG